MILGGVVVRGNLILVQSAPHTPIPGVLTLPYEQRWFSQLSVKCEEPCLVLLI